MFSFRSYLTFKNHRQSILTNLAKRLMASNILILTDDREQFTQIKDELLSIVGANRYTVYNLTRQDHIKSSIWMNNCVLLIVLNASSSQDQCLDFLKSGGSILSIFDDTKTCDRFANINNMDAVKSSFEFINQENTDRLINLYSYSNLPGFHYISEAPITNENRSVYKEFFGQVLKTISNDESSSNFTESYQIITKNPLLQSTNVIESYLLGQLNKCSHFQKTTTTITTCDDFNRKLYYEHLTTKKLGSIVLFTKLAKTTMDTLDMLPKSVDNVVVIAEQQTAGQGTHGNQWLSPKGCCMFTLFCNLKPQFSLSRLSLLQFAAGLACVKSVRTYTDLKDLPLEVKWPNDLYFNRKHKMGGILAKSSLMGSSALVKIGIGFNLNNEHPTECLNKILKERNMTSWTPEMFIARFLNHFEVLIEQLTDPSGLEPFLVEFQDVWMHRNQTVRVEHWDEEVEIVGLDEYGYLKAKRQDGSIGLLQPDGNRYDMMHNLLVLR